MARIEERKWNCPVVHHDADTGQILDAAADSTATQPDGYSIERVLISKEGCWSNCDVFLSVPATWRDQAVELRLYNLGPAGRALQANVFCDSADLQDDGNGTVSGIVLSARGAPGDGFLVVARTTTTVASGSIQLRLWGTESMPVGMGNAAAQGLPDRRVPGVASHSLAWFIGEAGAEWRPLRITASGELMVDASFSGDVIVAGDTTADGDDPFANPVTETIKTSSFLYGYSPDNGEWLSLKTDPLGILYVGLSGSVPTQDGGVTYLTNFYAGQVQNLNQHRVRGTGDWWLSRGGYVAAVPTADLDGIPNGLPLGIHNTVTPSLTNVQGSPLQLTSTGALKVMFDSLTGAFGNPFTVSSTGGASFLAPGTYPSTVALPYHSIRCGALGAWDTGGFVAEISAAEKDSLKNILGAAGYNATAPAPVDGGASALQADSRGNLIVMQGRPTVGPRNTPGQFSHTGVTREVIKASLGNILSFTVTSAEATQQLFFQLHNTATAPIDGDTAEFEWWLGSLVEAGHNVITIGRDFFSQAGCQFLLGISWAVSTTLGTLTLPASFNGSVSGTNV